MSSKSNFMDWNDRFLLGISLIDEQHESLIGFANKLYLACFKDKDTGNKLFIQIAHDVIEYARYHFHTEEKMMLLVDYCGFENHKKEHENFINEILIQEQQLSKENQFGSYRFVHFLKEWILSHIAVFDKEFSGYFLNIKYLGDIRKMLA